MMSIEVCCNQDQVAPCADNRIQFTKSRLQHRNYVANALTTCQLTLMTTLCVNTSYDEVKRFHTTTFFKSSCLVGSLVCVFLPKKLAHYSERTPKNCRVSSAFIMESNDA